MKIAFAGLLHETNTFAATRTTLRDFEAAGLFRRKDVRRAFGGTTGTVGGVLARAAELNVEIEPILYTFGTPSGLVEHSTYLALQSEIVSSLDGYDGILLALHGAMVSTDEDDVEGDLLDVARKTVGGSVPIVATLDLHGNVTQRMAANCDAWIGYKTSPHVDYFQRAKEAVAILHDAVTGVAKPVLRVANVPILASVQRMNTDEAPMKELMAAAAVHDRRANVLSTSIFGGFPYSDVPWAGMAVSCVSDGDAALAQKVCDDLAAHAWSLRESFTHRPRPVRDGVKYALSQCPPPVAIIDSSDNVGGGSAGDGTDVLAALLAERAEGAVCTLYDRQAAAAAAQSGVTSIVSLDVGAKTDTMHGAPVRVTGRVRLVSDGEYVSERTGEPQRMGLTAVVECERNLVVLTSERVPAFDVEALRSLGIDITRRWGVVIKGALQWKASYGELCLSSVEVDGAGITSANLFRFPFAKIRPVFPLAPDGEVATPTLPLASHTPQ